MTPEPSAFDTLNTLSVVSGVVAVISVIALLCCWGSGPEGGTEPVTDVPTYEPAPDLRNERWHRVGSPRVDVECFSYDSTIVCLSVLGC